MRSGESGRLGGCIGENTTMESRWFSVELDKSNALWAFAMGAPVKSIASLELFGTILCAVALGSACPRNANEHIALGGERSTWATPFCSHG